MERILWKDEYSVGIEKLDRQHKHLFEIINKLVTRPVASSGSNLVSQVLNEMYDYAKEHFTAEEELMQQYGYPELQAHKKQHEYFIGTTDELSSEKINPDEIAEFLKVWWLIHILKVDMKYKDFFKEKLAVTVSHESEI
jgi:hemerythrin